MVTDRNDLDQQLYEQFAGCQRFLRQEPQRVGFDLNEKGKLTKTAGREDLVRKMKDLQEAGPFQALFNTQTESLHTEVINSMNIFQLKVR